MVVNPDMQFKAFKNMLDAFYHQAYTLTSVDELQALATICDYYRALPSVTMTLTSALQNGLPRGGGGDLDLISLAKSAMKFRHRALFTDCIVLLAGRRNGFAPAWETLIPVTETQLRRIVKHTSNHVASKVALAFAALSQVSLQHPEVRHEVSDCYANNRGEPEFFRRIRRGVCFRYRISGAVDFLQLDHALHELLEVRNIS